ncbi:MAG: PQQ-dependent sugar dehydrogenase, partial [Chloroflexota bacterium]|nr:PQQ-dependent sugar dehydrogenase [Chloroflexota bacterium]
MRRPTPRLRVALAALLLTFAAALPPAPAGAADPGDEDAREGLVLRQPEGDGSGTPIPRSPQVATPAAATVPPNFRDELIVGGLDEPTVVQFAADGRMFVAEKRGRILLFDSGTDATPTVFANLETQVHNLWDRGFLGMVLDPAFTTGRPYVYVAYTANDIIGDGLGAPRWPSDPAEPWKDRCPSPPGTTTDGCVVSGRVSRLTAGGTPLTAGPEQQLVQAWCQQFPSHSMGSLAFGPEGALYVTGGEGASFFQEDWGQLGGTQPGTPTPVNPCGDPANQGGALRSQDLRTPTTDPVGLSGTLIRINPDTGAAWPTNNLIGSADTNAQRIIAYGLRNPFRFAIRPGSNEIWIGDVGNYSWEEINLVADPTAAPRNFGWPCYEGADDGPARNPDWDALDIAICENLYASSGAVSAPAFAYGREGEPPFVTGDGCGTDSSAIAGLTFLGTNSGYP